MTFIFFLPVLSISPQVINNSFIIIDADSRVEVPANEITFSITIQKVDTNAQNAYKGIKQKEKQFLPLLKKFNIPDTNITYSLIGFNQSAAYRNEPVKYQASENVVIKLHDFKEYEPFQLALISIGIYHFYGTFSTTKIKDARKEGFQKALDNAKSEAKIICDKIDRKLGKVLEVESNNRNYIVTSPMQSVSLTAVERKLIDIPQHVTLYTKLKVKYELK